MKRTLAHLGWGLLTGCALTVASPRTAAQTCSAYPQTGGVNKWPQGVVPYLFASDFPEGGKAAVRSAMAQWMDSGAAVAFVEYLSVSGTKPYLRIAPSSSGNKSALGPQLPTVATIEGNIQVGEESHIVHEMGHALGFPHEQSRPDRAAYVNVVRSHIDPSQYDANFDIVDTECWPPGSLRQPYDYDSIMHYDWCLGSVSGCSAGVQGQTDTMFATDASYQYSMGGWIGDTGDGLSAGDKMKAQYVYGRAIWVKAGSGCDFENGTRNCSDFFDFHGPYTTVTAAADTVATVSDPAVTLMIDAGNYTVRRIAKPMKLVGYRGGVRLQ